MDTKTSSPGERENVGAQPPCVSFDPTTLHLGMGSDIGCTVKDNQLVLVYGDFDIAGAGLFGTLVTPVEGRGGIAVWGANNGVPCNALAADAGRLVAVRGHDGPWKVFDPKVSALLPSVDSFLED